MEREARVFSLGAPHFYKGIQYNFPDRFHFFRSAYSQNHEAIGNLLEDKFPEYAKAFDINGFRPSISLGIHGNTLHFGMGGKWFEFWDNHSGDYVVADHNIDGYPEEWWSLILLLMF